ncbi:hypothetical protein QZH41_018675 [Actinostola sp. cb2023]|nr:hypothetical protein QZH41_018675 [Actinostola sp. cb2023]
MKLYLIAGLLAVLVVSGLSMNATQENEIPALLEFTNDFSAEDEIPALLNLVNDVSGGLVAVLVVSGLSMNATQENEIPALLEFTNDFSAEDEIPALLNLVNDVSGAGSWSSRHNRVGQWIQVDLNRVTKVTGIATQGRSDTNQWVKQYKLQYSSDGKTFNNYEGGKVHQGVAPGMARPHVSEDGALWMQIRSLTD